MSPGNGAHKSRLRLAVISPAFFQRLLFICHFHKHSNLIFFFHTFAPKTLNRSWWYQDDAASFNSTECIILVPYRYVQIRSDRQIVNNQQQTRH